jgi:hypothetical protein
MYVDGSDQGCQMVYFKNKNPNLGKFLRVLEWKMLVYFMVICYIIRSCVIFYVSNSIWIRI